MALINSDVIPAGVTTPYTIEQSLRFNDDDSAYLSWTPSSAGNRKTWTWSGWVKRGNLTTSGAVDLFVGQDSGGSNATYIRLLSTSDATPSLIDVGSTSGWTHKPSMVFRDTNSWYHIIVALDTTQSTATDRVKIYINGERVTDFNTQTNPSQDTDYQINENGTHGLGVWSNLSTQYFDGYLSEVNFIDGQALDSSYFGETGDYGEWKPKEYTGTYGTNGFYLPFKNDYTVEGFSTVTYTGDGSSSSYIGGVGFKPDIVWLKSRGAAGNHGLFDSVRGAGNILRSNTTDAEASNTGVTSFDPDGWSRGTAYSASGNTYVAWCWDMGGTNTNLITNGTFETLDNWTAVNYNNFSLQSGFMQVRPSTSGGDTYAYQDITTVSGSKYKITFDTGPANDDPQIWVVGSSTLLSSGSLSSNSSYSYEFTADSTSTQIRLGGNFVNESAYYRFDNVVVTLVATANTNGSITSLVRANPTYGQSIVSYTGTGATATIGHGLSSAPEMIIVKRRDAATNWPVWHTSVSTGTDDFIDGLNLTGGTVTSEPTFFTSTDPTASVFSVGSSSQTNASGSSHIAYCFHSVSGYSKFGSYTGDGTTDGSKTISLGFKPAFLIIKRTDGATDWKMFDNARNPTNPVDKILQPNLSNAEGDYDTIEFNDTSFGLLDNGGAINNSGSNYIYMAFADTREFAYWLDQSGNNNDWTSNNLTESDISVDSPTNNFAVINSLNESPDIVLSEGNLKGDFNDANAETFLGSIDFNSGKWYWEYRPTIASGSTGYYVRCGVGDAALNTHTGANDDADTYVWRSTGSNNYKYDGKIELGSNLSWGSGFSTYGDGDIIGVAVDADNDTVTWYKNGAYVYTQSSPSLPASGYWVPQFTAAKETGTVQVTVNFGQDSSFAGQEVAQGNTDGNEIGDFYYTPPSGYLALCTANLSDPAVIPSEHFNTVLYTGDGTSSNSITGVGFQPDLLWIKCRSSAFWHSLCDAVRGANTILYSNSTSAEKTDAYNGYINSLDTDGFTVGVSASNGTNGSGSTFVAWNWLANGSGSSNTNGTITSTVSANQDAGFSIVGYTGNFTEGATVGHGLSQAPEMIIVKRRNGANGWQVYVKSNGASKTMTLNLTEAAYTNTSIWYSTDPTSSVFTIGNNTAVNWSSSTYIAYCFHSVDGFSKVGYYTGNGSADGAFVYTGFRPAFVMFKSSSAVGNWQIMDEERLGYNGRNELLVPNGTYTEDSGATYPVDIMSNGFKMKDSAFMNGSGVTHIYIAFAENPFKYTNAR